MSRPSMRFYITPSTPYPHDPTPPMMN